MDSILMLVVSSVILCVSSFPRSFFEEEVAAWHIHTFFYEVKEASIREAINLWRKLRELIDSGHLAECSIYKIFIGHVGPFYTSQHEMCCNSTSFAAAYSFMAQNHGNLSVYIHPLTRYSYMDHTERSSWMGKKVVLDEECPCWPKELSKAQLCPIYPYFDDLQIPIPG